MRFAIQCLAASTALMLVACGESAGAKAEQQYEMIKKNTLATYGDRCTAANKAMQAYLEEGNQESYERWQLTSRNDCRENPELIATD